MENLPPISSKNMTEIENLRLAAKNLRDEADKLSWNILEDRRCKSALNARAKRLEAKARNLKYLTDIKSMR